MMITFLLVTWFVAIVVSYKGALSLLEKSDLLSENE